MATFIGKDESGNVVYRVQPGGIKTLAPNDSIKSDDISDFNSAVNDVLSTGDIALVSNKNGSSGVYDNKNKKWVVERKDSSAEVHIPNKLYTRPKGANYDLPVVCTSNDDTFNVNWMQTTANNLQVNAQWGSSSYTTKNIPHN